MSLALAVRLPSPSFRLRSTRVRSLATFAAALAACAAFAPRTAAADDDAELPPVGSPDAERMVVTATRTPLALPRVGSALTVIDAEELELQQDALLVDALERVPGLTVVRQGGPGTIPSVFIRGANSNQTLLLVDGVKLHDAAGPNRETQLDHVAVEDIERIEVLRGPQSVLYGSDAIGGVINVITKRERGAPHVRASVEGGSFGTNVETASVRGGGPRHYYAASLTRTDVTGFSIATTDVAGDRDGYERLALSNQVGFGGDALGIDLGFRYVDADVEIDSGGSPGSSYADARQFVGRVAPRASLFDGAWEQTLAWSVNHARRDSLAFGRSRFTGRLHEVDWQHTLRPLEALAIVVGAEWEREIMAGTSSGNALRVDVDAYSAYGDMQLSLLDAVDLAAGARVYHHEIFGTEVVGRGSAAVRIPDTGFKLRISAGNGFKAPTLGQLYDDTFGTNNPALEPERAVGADAGIAWRSADDRFGADVGVFANWIDDLIVGAAPTFVNANVAEARTRGVEASADAVLLERGSALGLLRARIDYTYLYTRDRLAQRRLLRRPAHEVSFSATWSPIERVDLTASVRWLDDRLDFSPVTFAIIEANDYAVVDVMVRFAATGWLDVYARVENAADEDYEAIAGFRQPGVAAYAGVRIDLERLWPR